MKNSIARLFISGAVALAGVGSLQNSNAQVQSVSPAPETTAQPMTSVAPPPDLQPTSPLAQVARLTQAGVDQGVILTYITNSASTFNLDSDRIIYLSNLGAPSILITAMMQRDQQLQAQFTASQAAQVASQLPPAQTAPTDAPAPADATNEAVDTQPAPVTVDYFDNSLAPYGTWIVVGDYGRCWQPTVCRYNPGWQPYCDQGHWVYSDCGWYWNSDYAWGATFHYGRWFHDANFGWCWYPDTVWAPSWVTWRYSDNYCGWAPLPPRTSFRAGVGIVYNGGSVSVGFGFGLAANCFTFVPTQRFCDPHPHNYRVAPSQVTVVYNNTTVINNYNVNNRTLFNHGIPAEHIAVATRTTLRPVPVHELNHNAGGYYNRPAYGSGTAYKTYSSPQPYSATENHFSQPQTAHITATTPIPQHQTSEANYYSPAHVAPTETLHNPTYNYYTPRQNYSHPSAAVPQQHNAPAQSQPQPSSNHGGNQPSPR